MNRRGRGRRRARLGFFSLVVLALAVVLSGCSMLAGTLRPTGEIATDQQYQSMPAILRALPADAKISELTCDLNVQSVQEPILDAQGRPMTDASGAVLYRVTTTTERGLPVIPGRTRFEAGQEFVKTKLAAGIHNSPGGSVLEFNQNTDVAEGAYSAGVQAQTAQMAGAWAAAGNMVQQAAGVATGYFGYRQTVGLADIQMRAQQAQQDALWRAIEAGVLPPGYALIPREASNGDTEASTPAGAP